MLDSQLRILIFEFFEIMNTSTLLIPNMTRADHDESIGVMDSPEPNFSLICENACKNENEVHMIRELVSFYINPDFSIACRS